jgi:2-polyprenyl-3-methyl-5-hydroxy-6-metoxy-1,4-benzoquinol methylase
VKDKILEMVKQSAAREKPYGWLNYQPINLPGYEDTLPLRGRDCFDRSGPIFAHMKKTFGEQPLSIVDWGCNLGFFVFEAAKLGHIARGYDADKRLIEADNYLASTGQFRSTPVFEQRTLSSESVHPADVIFCFSVLHHIQPDKERFKTLDAIASKCKGAYIEMDGSHHGQKALELFFWKVEQVAETNDRYGSGHRHRKTFYCTNRDGDRTYVNLKKRDYVYDRAVFLCTKASGERTVFKRERPRESGKFSHTWLKTSLAHEREIYEKHASPWIPKLLNAGNGDFQFIEIEYVEHRGPATPDAVDGLFKWLEAERLFVIDYRTDGFVPCDGTVKMIDLESVFPLQGDVASTVAQYSINPGRNPGHLHNYDSYEKQRAALKKSLAK